MGRFLYGSGMSWKVGMSTCPSWLFAVRAGPLQPGLEWVPATRPGGAMREPSTVRPAVTLERWRSQPHGISQPRSLEMQNVLRDPPENSYLNTRERPEGAHGPSSTGEQTRHACQA